MLQLTLNQEEFELKKIISEELAQDETKLTNAMLNHLNASIPISYVDQKISQFIELDLNNQVIDTSTGSSLGVNYILGNYDVKCELSRPFTFKKRSVLKYSSGSDYKYFIHFTCCCNVVINIKCIDGKDLSLKHMIL
jgi:hypothetical protein